uniref:Globin domain-containing protein n=1 Tax=Trichogramma kaykai TaxID=54128 RepID=A0ABD2WCX2_9HYME
MGCKLGKLTFSRTIRDSHLNQESPPLPPATDPRLPLTARQKYILSASWKAIAKAIEPTGIYMFIRLFEENEELLKMFDKLKHLKTREEQFDSPELAEHAQKVMNTLDEGIQGLDDLDVFLDFLHQIGASHSKIPGFQSDFFWTRLAGDSVTGPTTHSGMPWSLACCRVHLEAREGRKWTRKHNDASTSHHSTDCSSGTSKTSADASLPA